MGWRPDLQDEVPDAEKPEARSTKRLASRLPDQDRVPPDWVVPQLDEESAHVRVYTYIRYYVSS